MIKAPDISDIDWESMVKKKMDALNIDRSQTAVAFNMHFGYFQSLMAFMGFNEGLCAMYEEPMRSMHYLTTCVLSLYRS